VNAPMIQVNNEWVYEDLDYDSMTAMLKDWKDGKEPKKGPQNGRINSCGIEGRTSLHGESTGPVSRDFDACKNDYEAAKAAAAAAKK
jgi:NADH dehydrogenase (ubiquinone) flavoprotein 2